MRAHEYISIYEYIDNNIFPIEEPGLDDCTRFCFPVHLSPPPCKVIFNYFDEDDRKAAVFLGVSVSFFDRVRRPPNEYVLAMAK